MSSPRARQRPLLLLPRPRSRQFSPRLAGNSTVAIAQSAQAVGNGAAMAVHVRAAGMTDRKARMDAALTSSVVPAAIVRRASRVRTVNVKSARVESGPQANARAVREPVATAKARGATWTSNGAISSKAARRASPANHASRVPTSRRANRDRPSRQVKTVNAEVDAIAGAAVIAVLEKARRLTSTPTPQPLPARPLKISRVSSRL